jgi:site-specific DNA-methyltransferase (adenine-specific)
MELRDFEAFGEPGAMVYLADCVDLMKIMPPESVDMIFADPPYRLSNGGVTVKNGSLVPVNKGEWDRSMGFQADHRFNVDWLREARRILKPDGTIWVTGTHHIIFSLGFALQSMNFKLINQITWAKPDPPPNTLHTAFTHAHETLLWASKNKGARHTFNYDLINSPDPTSQGRRGSGSTLSWRGIGSGRQREAGYLGRSGPSAVGPLGAQTVGEDPRAALEAMGS